MANSRIEVFAELRHFGRAISISFRTDDGVVQRYAMPPDFVDVPDEDRVRPTFDLDKTSAQQLMDELWRCGLRPSEGTGSAGSLAATEKHLQDMRKIAFGLLRDEGIQP